ncbi:MAG: hypothetical protein ACR2OZ_19670 [Verrucomicrobiales bacterium]
MLIEVAISGALLACLVASGISNRIRRAARTKKVWAVGFPLGWLRHLDSGLSVYSRLPLDLREKLQQLAFFKINDLLFDGKGVYENLSEEIIVSLGAHLALLHANIRIPPLPSIRTVVVGTPADLEELIAASSEPLGDSVLLTAWDPEARAARMFREERDPQIKAHWQEFAPQADERLFFAGWARSLHSDSPRGRARAAEIMPDLGTNVALFAAASEAFIRHPVHLASQNPSIYDALRAFYRLDPACWKT